MTLAGKEKVVSNKHAIEFYENTNVSVTDKEFKIEDEATHLLI